MSREVDDLTVAIARLREAAALQLTTVLRDRVVWVGEDKPLQVVHRLGRQGETRCGQSTRMGWKIPAERAIQQVDQPCTGCEWGQP